MKIFFKPAEVVIDQEITKLLEKPLDDKTKQTFNKANSFNQTCLTSKLKVFFIILFLQPHEKVKIINTAKQNKCFVNFSSNYCHLDRFLTHLFFVPPKLLMALSQRSEKNVGGLEARKTEEEKTSQHNERQQEKETGEAHKKANLFFPSSHQNGKITKKREGQ